MGIGTLNLDKLVAEELDKEALVVKRVDDSLPEEKLGGPVAIATKASTEPYHDILDIHELIIMTRIQSYLDRNDLCFEENSSSKLRSVASDIRNSDEYKEFERNPTATDCRDCIAFFQTPLEELIEYDEIELMDSLIKCNVDSLHLYLLLTKIKNEKLKPEYKSWTLKDQIILENYLLPLIREQMDKNK